MLESTIRFLRYGRSWLGAGDDVVEDEVEVRREDGAVPATVYAPKGEPGPLPGWVVLHGITRPGRRHPQLVRFVRALAASRAAVIVPEVPEWVELDLAPSVTAPTVRAAVGALRRTGRVAATRPVGLVGFSFGSPQALVASTREGLGDDLATVVGFGGYCDLERTVRFQLTGKHRWRGEEWEARPDPYGRWIIAANFLDRVPGREDAADVAAALRTLAKEAGDRRIPAEDPAYDASKERLRERIAPERRAIFDVFAPPAGSRPDPDAAEEWIEAIVETARRHEPLMDPGDHLDAVTVPVHLLHGRSDRLIPFTETLRLGERLPAEVPTRTTVTGLFSHSTDHPVRSVAERAREGFRFAGALRRVLGAV